jgi:hypothetical protein
MIPKPRNSRCGEKGCDYIGNDRGLSIHRASVHGIGGTSPKAQRDRQRREKETVRGEEPKQSRASSGASIPAAYAKGKIGRFAGQLDRRAYHETAEEIREGIDDIAETIEEVSKLNDNARMVLKWALLVIGSGAAVMTFAAVFGTFMRERRAKLEARQAEREEWQRQQAGAEQTQGATGAIVGGVSRLFGRQAAEPDAG